MIGASGSARDIWNIDEIGDPAPKVSDFKNDGTATTIAADTGSDDLQDPKFF